MPRTPRGGTNGRPAFVPTDQQRETVKVMVAGGITQEAIAGCLGIAPMTLTKHFRAEIDHGAAQINAVVVAMHITRIREGDMHAIKWWQQARMGWSEKITVDDGKLADTPMRVTVELVGEAVTPQPDTGPRPTTRPGFNAAKLVQLVG